MIAKCPQCGESKAILVTMPVVYFVTETNDQYVIGMPFGDPSTRLLPTSSPAFCNVIACGWEGTLQECLTA